VETDDCKSLMEAHADFDVRLVPQPRGLCQTLTGGLKCKEGLSQSSSTTTNRRRRRRCRRSSSWRRGRCCRHLQKGAAALAPKQRLWGAGLGRKVCGSGR
jgi:hypothetical protein